MTKVRNSCVGTDPTEQDWLQPGSDACQVHPMGVPFGGGWVVLLGEAGAAKFSGALCFA